MEQLKNAIVRTSWNDATAAWTQLTKMSSGYICGVLGGYQPLSCRAYLAGYELKTLAQTLMWGGCAEHALAQRILESAEAVLRRARENEVSHEKGELARTQAYFDDLLDMQDLQEARMSIGQTAKLQPMPVAHELQAKTPEYLP